MKPTVRVLVATDRFDGGFLAWPQKAPDHSFHLGEFVKVLKDTAWMGFKVEITRAHKESPGPGETAASMMAATGADVVGFRFDQDFEAHGKTWALSDFDMVLFLPIDFPGSVAEAQLASEAAAIARFMEDGGGFFATGDHGELGASLCQWIPRVRSMRRWWGGGSPAGDPPTPPGSGPDRIDTTRPGADGQFQFEDQSDEIAQEIDITWWGNSWSGKYPHPLLCSPAGAIKYLPDHMHEGICEVPDNLGGRTFELDGATVAEYPDHEGDPLAPVVVATGDVLGGHTTPALDNDDHFNDATPVNAATFGVIGAWDGHRVGRGRVVVDSTWHHFFNINLTGDKYLEGLGVVPADDQRLFGFYVPDGMGGRTASPHYEQIQWYYRNIVYWLIPAHRHTPIWWNTLADLAASAPRLKEELAFGWNFKKFDPDQFDFGAGGFDKWLHYGQLAEQYLKLARGACSRLIIKDKLYKPKIPWWEWVQETIDPWDPVVRERLPELEALGRLQVLGLAPRLDSLLTAGLGMALAMAASVRAAERHGLSDKVVEALDRTWSGGLDALTREFRARLREGVDLVSQLDRAMETRARAI